MNKFSLPEGNWAVVRDPKKVSERKRRPIMLRIAEANLEGSVEKLRSVDVSDEAAVTAHIGPTQLLAFSEINDLLVVALVDDWSFEQPVELESLLDLPGDAYDELRKAVTPYLTDIIPDFGVSPDPKALTGSSPDSTSS